MQVIALMNMKGGVGKTTLAVNLAYSLAHFDNKRILLVDVDPQFNATQSLVSTANYLAHIEAERPTILDIFQPQRSGNIQTTTGSSNRIDRTNLSMSDCVMPVLHPTTTGGQLDVIPSRLKLLEVQNSERQTEALLGRFLHAKAQGYDYVFLDCPPTISVFTQAAFLAADKYLVPIKPDPLSVIGLPLLERWLQDYAHITARNVEKIGLVFTMVRNPAPAQMQEVIRDVRRGRPTEVFEPMLSQSTAVASSLAPRSPLVVRKPSSKSAREIRAIAAEFLRRTT